MPGAALDGVAVVDQGKKFQKFNKGRIDPSGCNQTSEDFESNRTVIIYSGLSTNGFGPANVSIVILNLFSQPFI